MADWEKKSPGFDFEKGEFLTFGGKVRCLQGRDRVKNKVEKLIRTELGRYRIYEGVQYGVRIEDLVIGQTFTSDFIKNEIQREITEALLRDEEISSVDSFEAQVNDCMLNVKLYITTVFGSLEVTA